MPLAAMVAAGLAEGALDIQLWPPEILQATKPDVIVWQRQMEESQIEAMRRVREALPETFFVYELDDYIAGVPESNYHSAFVPPNSESRIAAALQYCDAVTVTTQELADWFKTLGAKDIRVAPNLLPGTSLKAREDKVRLRTRIGWGGGISHGGDLAIIRLAMEKIGDRVDWVFLGMKPENLPDGLAVEFHEGVPPDQYLPKLQSLDLDLIVAPLEDNYFNRCKSNLRLLEAGACEAAVIAQKISPYLTDNPPVFGYATTPEEWADQIERFINSPVKRRHQAGHAMQAWVRTKYTFEARIEERAKAWLPKSATLFKPHTQRNFSQFVVASDGPKGSVRLPPELEKASFADDLEIACDLARSKGASVVWVRSGTTLDDSIWFSLKSAQMDDVQVASVSPVSQYGVNAFPGDQGQTISPEIARQTEAILKETFGPTQIRIGAPIGPCVLLRGPALGVLGTPDVAGCGRNPEAAILEWGARANAKGFHHLQLTDCYVGSLAQPMQIDQVIMPRIHGRRLSDALKVPSESLNPGKRRTAELTLLKQVYGGLRPGFGGVPATYEAWRALKPVREDKPGLPVLRYGERLPSTAPENGWTILLAEGFTLHPGAAARFKGAADAAPPEMIAIYCDHEVEHEGKFNPVFKTGFDLEYFLARDYVTPAIAFRNEFAAMIDDELRAYEEIQFALKDRVDQPQRIIGHIPEILASGPIDADEGKLKSEAEKRAAIARDLIPGVKITPHRIPGFNSVVHVPAGTPRVSIVIPTRGSGWILQPCLNTLLRFTDYPNYEVVVVMNDAAAPDIGVLAKADPRVRVLNWPHPFNFSALNNWAVKQSAGEYICLMNDDIRVTTKDWLRNMLGQAMQHDVGLVGARLLYGMGAVQHVGVVVNRSANGHIHKMLPANQAGYHGLAVTTHENNAVTGACVVVSREKYDALGGLDERYSHNYNDVDICMKARRRGWRNVVEITAEMQHLESVTRPLANSAVGIARLQAENQMLFSEYKSDPDPYWNPNFTLAPSPDGMMISGLHYDLLSWDARKPTETDKRVLVINDTPGVTGFGVAVTSAGGVALVADLSGYTLTPDSPRIQSTKTIDVRDTEGVKTVLSTLGVTQIIIGDLFGKSGPIAVVEALRCLKRTDIEVIAGFDERAIVCPRVTQTVNGEPCGEAWRYGAETCQKCVNTHGSPFGIVDVPAWWLTMDSLMREETAAEEIGNA